MENYYDNSSRWVFDSDGNYLHSKRNTYEPHIQREGYFFIDTKVEESEWERYLLKDNNLLKRELINEKEND
jgi:hypothetical protein